MYIHLHNKQFDPFKRITAGLLLVIFLITGIAPVARAQSLPAVSISSSIFQPLLLQGVQIYPDNPFRFDFIVDDGQRALSEQTFKDESARLVKYFLASLTVPENDLWVNLSPHEQNRIITEAFGQTEMGRDLLAQDLILKQMTATLMSPENEFGEKFWDQVKEKIRPDPNQLMAELNKVWIVPDRAEVYVHNNTVFVTDAHLKVMMEEDNVSLRGAERRGNPSENTRLPRPNGLAMTETIKQTILPVIEKEVNEGEAFAKLRQIYYSMILAAWYKKNLKVSLLGEIYFNQNKIAGVDILDKNAKEKIYRQYLESFQKGVFEYIKDDYDPQTQEIISRKYFSGGVNGQPLFKVDGVLTERSDFAQANSSEGKKHLIEVALNTASDRAILGKEGDRNSVYINATIENGKRVGGEFIGAYPNQIRSNVLNQFDEIVITNMRTDKNRSIQLASKNSWIGENRNNLLAYVKKGELVAAYDEEGKQVYTQAVEGSKNSVYINAKIVNGKREGGEFYKAYPGQLSANTLEKLGEIIITNMQTTADGILAFGGNKGYWRDKTRPLQSGLTVHIKNSQLVAVYDENGKQLYTPPTEGDRNSLYIGATIKNGKHIGGRWAEAFPLSSPNTIFNKYSEFILSNVQLDAAGAFYFGGKIFWSRRALYKNATGITAHIKNGILIEAYDKNGKKIFERVHEGSRNSIYAGARIENGKRVDGEFIGAYPSKVTPEILKKSAEIVIENIHLQSRGGLTIGGKIYALYLYDYENAENIMGYFKNGILEKLYDKVGKEIYSKPKEGERNSVYINATLKDGVRVGGEFKEAYPFEFTPSNVLKLSENIVVENIQLASNGAFTFAGTKYWASLAGYENAKNLKAYFRNGILDQVIDANKKAIYTGDITQQPNVIYKGAKIVNGKVVGGKAIRSYRENVPQNIYKELDDFIITNVSLNKQGGGSAR